MMTLPPLQTDEIMLGVGHVSAWAALIVAKANQGHLSITKIQGAVSPDGAIAILRKILLVNNGGK